MIFVHNKEPKVWKKFIMKKKWAKRIRHALVYLLYYVSQSTSTSVPYHSQYCCTVRLGLGAKEPNNVTYLHLHAY